MASFTVWIWLPEQDSNQLSYQGSRAFAPRAFSVPAQRRNICEFPIVSTECALRQVFISFGKVETGARKTKMVVALARSVLQTHTERSSI